MPYYTRDTLEYSSTHSVGVSVFAGTPGMHSYPHPGLSSRVSASSSSSSSTLPSPLSASSPSYRPSGWFLQTSEHDASRDGVFHEPYTRRMDRPLPNAFEPGKPIDHAGMPPCRTDGREGSHHERETRSGSPPTFKHSANYSRVNRPHDSTTKRPYFATSVHSEGRSHVYPLLTTPPPSSPTGPQTLGRHTGLYSMEIEAKNAGEDCQLVLNQRASPFSSHRLPKPSPHQRHRRTHSSPFSYSSRASPLAFECDRRLGPQYAYTISPSGSQHVINSHHTLDLPQPPRSAPSIASLTYLDYISDREDSHYTHITHTPEEDVDILPDNESTYALSPVRRRISFSTSAERDTPFIPNTPTSPIIPSHEGSIPRGRGEKGRKRVFGRVDARPPAKKGERKAEEMLPTPPMSSPELELAQPLPLPKSSQPARREPSIPVGSMSAITARERKRKERPTLMDLLSSPQPSVSPERPPMTSASTIPHRNIRDEDSLSSESLRETSHDTLLQSTSKTDIALSPSTTMRDMTLPPSSPFTSPLSSPGKSTVMPSPSPSSSPAPRMRGETPMTVDDAVTTGECTYVIAATEEALLRAVSPSSLAGVPTTKAQESMGRTTTLRPGSSQQLPTPSTPEPPMDLPANISPDASLAVESIAFSSPINPEALAPTTPKVAPAVEPPIDISPLNVTTTISVQVNIKDEQVESDVEMSDVHGNSAPSSPLSSVPSPSSVKLRSVTLSPRHVSPSVASESEDVLPRASVTKKRKVTSSLATTVPRKKTRVAPSPPDVTLSPSDSDRESELSEEDMADGRILRRKVITQVGQEPKRPRGASTSRTSRKSRPVVSSDNSDDDEEQLAPSRVPSPAISERVVKEAIPPSPKRSKDLRRPSSPPMSSSEPPRSPSPQREVHTATSRARSKSSKPSKGYGTLDWHALSPLPIPELEGMLIEILATSRATSLSVSALWDALLRTRPALRTMARRAPSRPSHKSGDPDNAGDGDDAVTDVDRSPLNKREWLQLLTYILAAGHLSSGVFGRVESSASDSDSRSKKKRCLLTMSSNRAEPVSDATLHEISKTKSAQRAQWFYMPEKDVDQDRASLVRTMMRGPGKRSETMKYKRYYWKPLGKISRWDREDDL